MTLNQINQLSNDDLLAAVARAAAIEREATVELLRLLMEIDRRQLHLAQGYPSMFAYCTRALRLSEHATYSRITAARTARRFPQLFDDLATGSLSLSTIGLLGPHLKNENGAGLIDWARGKSTREVERHLAALHPKPDVSSSLRARPIAHAAESASALPAICDSTLQLSETTSGTASVAPALVTTPSRARDRALRPISARTYVLRITINQAAHDKLQQLRALMRHSVPDGDPAAIVERALSVLLEDVKRRKCAIASRQRPSMTEPGKTTTALAASTQTTQWRAPVKSATRRIPAAVRRAVWTRDEARCAFVGADGRCNETGFIELHHVVPFARGGVATVDTSFAAGRTTSMKRCLLSGIGALPTAPRPAEKQRCAGSRRFAAVRGGSHRFA